MRPPRVHPALFGAAVVLTVAAIVVGGDSLRDTTAQTFSNGDCDPGLSCVPYALLEGYRCGDGNPPRLPHTGEIRTCFSDFGGRPGVCSICQQPPNCDAEKAECRTRLPQLMQADFSPDGRYVVFTGDIDANNNLNYAFEVDLSTLYRPASILERPASTRQLMIKGPDGGPNGYEDPLTGAAVSPLYGANGRYLAGSRYQLGRYSNYRVNGVYDRQDDDFIALPEAGGTIMAAGKTIAYSKGTYRDVQVILRDMVSGEERQIRDKNTTLLNITPDGKTVLLNDYTIDDPATNAYTMYLTEYDVATGTERKTVTNGINFGRMSADGRYLLCDEWVYGQNRGRNAFCVWDRETQTKKDFSVPVPALNPLSATPSKLIAISDDGGKVLFGYLDTMGFQLGANDPTGYYLFDTRAGTYEKLKIHVRGEGNNYRENWLRNPESVLAADIETHRVVYARNQALEIFDWVTDVGTDEGQEIFLSWADATGEFKRLACPDLANRCRYTNQTLTAVREAGTGYYPWNPPASRASSSSSSRVSSGRSSSAGGNGNSGGNACTFFGPDQYYAEYGSYRCYLEPSICGVQRPVAAGVRNLAVTRGGMVAFLLDGTLYAQSSLEDRREGPALPFAGETMPPQMRPRVDGDGEVVVISPWGSGEKFARFWRPGPNETAIPRWSGQWGNVNSTTVWPFVLNRAVSADNRMGIVVGYAGNHNELAAFAMGTDAAQVIAQDIDRASVSADGNSVMYSVRTAQGVTLNRREISTGAVKTVQLPAGAFVLAASDNANIVLWGLNGAYNVVDISANAASEVVAIDDGALKGIWLSPDGGTVAYTISANGADPAAETTAYTWNRATRTATQIASFVPNAFSEKRVTAAGFATDGAVLVTTVTEDPVPGSSTLKRYAKRYARLKPGSVQAPLVEELQIDLQSYAEFPGRWASQVAGRLETLLNPDWTFAAQHFSYSYPGYSGPFIGGFYDWRQSFRRDLGNGSVLLLTAAPRCPDVTFRRASSSSSAVGGILAASSSSSSVARAAYCGNGVVEEGEECEVGASGCSQCFIVACDADMAVAGELQYDAAEDEQVYGRSILDPKRGFAYFFGATNVPRDMDRNEQGTNIYKIRLSDFTEVDRKVIAAVGQMTDAAIDVENNVGYFLKAQAQGYPDLYRIRLSDMAVLNTLSFPQGTGIDGEGAAMVFDAKRNALYVGMRRALLKISADLTQTSRIPLQLDVQPGTTPIIDSAGKYAYFAADTGIMKIDLDAFSVVTDIDIGGRNTYGAMALDEKRGLLYVASIHGSILRVAADTLTLNYADEILAPGGATAAMIDKRTDMAYFAMGNSRTQPATLEKVRLSDFKRVSTLILPLGTADMPNQLSPGDSRLASGVIDPNTGAVYLGGYSQTNRIPSRVLKIQTRRPICNTPGPQPVVASSSRSSSVSSNRVSSSRSSSSVWVDYSSRSSSVPGGNAGVGACRRTGCNNEICADRDVVTACVWNNEYACYNQGGAICERGANGQCGWRDTAQLRMCLADVRALADPRPPSCAAGVAQCDPRQALYVEGGFCGVDCRIRPFPPLPSVSMIRSELPQSLSYDTIDLDRTATVALLRRSYGLPFLWERASGNTTELPNLPPELGGSNGSTWIDSRMSAKLTADGVIIAIAQDRNLYIHNRSTGQWRLITNALGMSAASSGNSAGTLPWAMSPNARFFAYSESSGMPGTMGMRYLNAVTGESKRLYRQGYYYFPRAVSEDGEQVLVTEVINGQPGYRTAVFNVLSEQVEDAGAEDYPPITQISDDFQHVDHIGSDGLPYSRSFRAVFDRVNRTYLGSIADTPYAPYHFNICKTDRDMRYLLLHMQYHRIESPTVHWWEERVMMYDRQTKRFQHVPRTSYFDCNRVSKVTDDGSVIMQNEYFRWNNG